jgi:hypothetical protein
LREPDPLTPAAQPGGEPPPAASLAEMPMRGAKAAPRRKAERIALGGGAILARGRTAASTSAARPPVPTDGSPAAIVRYWRALWRGGRPPSSGDFDADEVGRVWPDCLLLSFERSAGREQGLAKAARFGTSSGESASLIAYTSLITDWVLGLGRRAVGGAEPIEEVETFDSPLGRAATYRLLLLPLAPREGVYQVLCHLSCI